MSLKNVDVDADIVKNVMSKLGTDGLVVVSATGGHVVGFTANALRLLLDQADKSATSTTVMFVRSQNH